MSRATGEARIWSVLDWLRRHLWVLALIVVAGAAITSEAGRFHAQREAADYRKLWKAEQNARRTAINGRLAQIEAQVANLPEVPDEYQDRLIDVRRRFGSLLRGEAGPVAIVPACPKPPAPPAAPGADDAPVVTACPHTETLVKLQAWVREHMAAYHGVDL